MTSGPRLVKPHAMSALWPMITPGTPAKEKPLTSSGQACDTVRQLRLFWIQMPGWLTPRCGSLASSGFPVVVRAPDTAHEFEPMPAPRPTSWGMAFSASCTFAYAACADALVSRSSPGAATASAGVEARVGDVVRADGTADWVARSGTRGDHSSVPRIGGWAS